MVEQNENNANNEEAAPKRRSRLFGGRRARSAGSLEARADAQGRAAVTDAVASGAPVSDTAASDTAASDTAGAGPGTTAESAAADEATAVAADQAVTADGLSVEVAAGGTDQPHDVSALTGEQPVLDGIRPSVEPSTAQRAQSGDEPSADDRSADAPATEEPSDAAPSDAASSDAAGSASYVPRATSTLSLIFHAPVLPELPARPVRPEPDDLDDEPAGGGRRRTRRRGGSDAPEPRQRREPELITEPQRIKGSTRLEAKKQRRRDGRDAGRRRQVITEDEFLARRESVDRQMIVRSNASKIEIGVLEDGILAEHYVTKSHNVSLIGNVYLGKVQNVLPSMEAAFVDIGRGRNAVLYAGEVDWNSVDTSSGRRIEAALRPGDRVLVQVTKDPVGHKGARLTSQVSLPGRYLVYVPNGSMNGISRKLPDTERARLKKILKEVLPEHAGVIVRTAAEGATEDQLTRDVQRLTSQWESIEKKVQNGHAPAMLHSEPDLLVKIVRDVFNEDFTKLIIDGDAARGTIEDYLTAVAPDLKDRVEIYDGPDSFEEHRLNEQIEKALDRKVWLPSGGSLVIDRTEAMTVVDVNTGKFVGSGGNLEETVTKNNLEAAEEIVRQLRLRDIGGIIVVDFIDMVLESNRDLVLRRLVECLSRDRTKHQVAEVTSLGLVQMTRKKIGVGLRESLEEVNAKVNDNNAESAPNSKSRRKGRSGNGNGGSAGGNGSSGGSGDQAKQQSHQAHQITDDVKNALSRIAASTIAHDEVAPQSPVTGVATPGRSSAGSPASAPDDDAVAVGTSDVGTSSADTVGSQEPSERTGKRRSRGRRARSSEQDQQQDTPQPDRSAQGHPESGDAGRQGDRATEPAQSSVSGSASAEPEQTAAPATRRRVSSSAPVTPADTSVAILDIPVAVTKREPRKVDDAAAESLLDSVLQSLPEPKQPGQGRAKSRRVSSGSISAPATASEQDGDGPVILGG